MAEKGSKWWLLPVLAIAVAIVAVMIAVAVSQSRSKELREANAAMDKTLEESQRVLDDTNRFIEEETARRQEAGL